MKALFIAGSAQSLVNFRGPLIREFLRRGWQVDVAAPGLAVDRELLAWFDAECVKAIDISMDRTGINPLSDLKALFLLWRYMRNSSPDMVFGYTVKPVIFGTLAAWLAGIGKRCALISGLGYAFTGPVDGKRKFIHYLVRALYRVALSKATSIIFQNSDDAALFANTGLIKDSWRVSVVNGSGIDLEYYRHLELQADGDAVNFLMIARLLKTKGLCEFAAAATEIMKDYPQARFSLVGGVDPNPDAISESEVEGWVKGGVLRWFGEQRDVRPFLRGCDVYVLPSYREGTPRSVLEAMATGRAIITTDAPGCRETVVQGENGFLVPVGDAGELAVAMRKFLRDPSLAARMGRRSLEIVRAKYDVNIVNQAMFKAMDIAS